MCGFPIFRTVYKKKNPQSISNSKWRKKCRVAEGMRTSCTETESSRANSTSSHYTPFCCISCIIYYKIIQEDFRSSSIYEETFELIYHNAQYLTVFLSRIFWLVSSSITSRIIFRLFKLLLGSGTYFKNSQNALQYSGNKDGTTGFNWTCGHHQDLCFPKTW